MDNNINVLVVLIFTMGALLVSAAVITARKGAAKGGELFCVGGKWLQVGYFRIWQRKQCVKRRQEPPPEGTQEPPEPEHRGDGPGDGQAVIQKKTTVNFDLILPSLEAGPPRGRPEYSPTYGYEPYWTGGDWMFDRDPGSMNATLYMCGVRCPKVYTEYGTICGRNKDYVYETFVNFCQLRNKDCSNIERWMVMYRGTCFRNLTLYSNYAVKNRTVKFIEDFMKQYKAEPYVGFCDPCPAEFA